MAECSLTSCMPARFWIGSYTLPEQRHSQPTPTSLDQGCMCLGVTCHLHFWQNDRGLLRATAVTRGRNGHRIESAQKINSGEENFPPLLSGFELAIFRSRVRRSYQQAIPARPFLPRFAQSTFYADVCAAAIVTGSTITIMWMLFAPSPTCSPDLRPEQQRASELNTTVNEQNGSFGAQLHEIDPFV